MDKKRVLTFLSEKKQNALSLTSGLALGEVSVCKQFSEVIAGSEVNKFEKNIFLVWNIPIFLYFCKKYNFIKKWKQKTD